MKKDLIAQWKADFGSVFLLEIEEYSIYYRTLTAWEIQSILDLYDQNKAKVDIEHAVCVFGVLDPLPLPSFNKPGSITTLSDDIWNKSVPRQTETEAMITKSREWAENSIDKNYNLVISGIMCKLLPSLDITRLLDLPTNKLIKLGVVIEKLSGTLFLNGQLSSTKSNSTKIMSGSNISQDEANNTANLLANALKEHKQNIKKK